MVLRLILRLLANNEQLVQKISESYPMRRAAQFVVCVMFQGKYFIEEKGLNKKLTPEEFRNAIRQIAQNLQGQIKQAQEQFKKK